MCCVWLRCGRLLAVKSELRIRIQPRAHVCCGAPPRESRKDQRWLIEAWFRNGDYFCYAVLRSGSYCPIPKGNCCGRVGGLLAWHLKIAVHLLIYARQHSRSKHSSKAGTSSSASSSITSREAIVFARAGFGSFASSPCPSPRRTPTPLRVCGTPLHVRGNRLTTSASAPSKHGSLVVHDPVFPFSGTTD